jgi:hypothetical protein
LLAFLNSSIAQDCAIVCARKQANWRAKEASGEESPW